MEGNKRKRATMCELASEMSRKKTCFSALVQDTSYQSTLEQEIFHLTNNFTFFPDLVWELVAQKFKTPDEIENFSNSGPYFNYLLRKKRKTVKREREVVLPAVFEILAKKFAKSGDKSYKETNRKSVTWNRPKRKPLNKMTGLWKCRLVCKSWNKAIEDLHQPKDSVHIVYDRRLTNPISATKNEHLAKYAHFDFVSNTSKFIRECNETHYDNYNNCVTKNPFLGRSVTMCLVLNSANNHILVEKRNNTCELLEKWGREIWYCTIIDNCLRPRSDEIEFYRSLQNFLFKMPNLKSLSILCKRMSMASSKPEISRLKREMCENPLPALPNLLYFSCIYLPSIIYKHIRSVNNLPKECVYYGP